MGKFLDNPEFHPALAEKEIGVPPLCLEVLPGLRSLGQREKSDFSLLDAFERSDRLGSDGASTTKARYRNASHIKG
jgi:hypothetical protein